MKKPIPGYPSYEITDDGFVYSNCRGKTNYKMSPSEDSDGYLVLSMPNGIAGRKTKKVHRLVALTFIGPCPEGYTVNHKNGNKKDNRITNLEYCTPVENIQHAARNGLLPGPIGEVNGQSKLKEEDIKRIRSSEFAGCRQKDIAAVFCVSQSVIGDVLLGRSWKHI